MEYRGRATIRAVMMVRYSAIRIFFFFLILETVQMIHVSRFLIFEDMTLYVYMYTIYMHTSFSGEINFKFYRGER